MTMEEVWAKLTDTKQDSGGRGHELTGGLAHHGSAHNPMACPHCCDIRDAMLAVLDEAYETRMHRTKIYEALRTCIQELGKA